MIKDKVVKVKEDGEYNGRPKWKVQTQRSGEYTFFTNFNAVAGDIIEFSVNNEKYKTAKLLEVVDSKIPKAGKSNYDTGQSILRQVAFKGAIELVANGKISLSDVEQYTNEYHIILNKPVK
jgi:predicted peptidase